MTTLGTSQFIPLLSCCLVLAGLQGQARGASLLGHEIPSYLEFSDRVYTVTQDRPSVLITVVRSGEFRQPVSVQYATADSTARAGLDYTTATGSLLIPAGVGIATFSVPILSDPLNQDTVTVLLNLSHASPNALITRSNAVLNIMSPASVPPAPALTVRPAGHGGIVISWPASTVGCVLEESLQASGGSWTTVNATVETVNGYCQVVQTVAGGQFFYRLRLP